MTGIKMNVEFPTRLCEVNGKLGYFHRWEQWSKVVDASPLRGGHPGASRWFSHQRENRELERL